ncbi:MAG: copper amine oxidase N-terminal domain-containing protein [Clostridia bacterium]|nr:copper amine oxidase N-terminal domain-containing protein [Clostridia bacterium]
MSFCKKAISFCLILSLLFSFAVYGAGSLSSPVVYNPSDGGSYPKGDMTIRWYSVSGAARYDVAVRDMTSGVKIVGQDGAEGGTGVKTSSTYYTIPASKLIENHQYKVCVSSEDASGNQWPTYLSFYITKTELPAPTVILPSEGQVLSKQNITISWYSVQGASQYDVAVRDLTNNQKIVGQDGYDGGIGIKTGSTSYTISSSLLTEGHQYKIWVAAVDSNGIISNNGTYRTFNIMAEPELPAPQLTYPVDGQSCPKENITIRWNAVSGASQYDVAVRDLSNNVKIVGQDGAEGGTGVKTTGTSYTVSSALLTEGHQYRIGVAAVNVNGKVSNNMSYATVTVSKAPPLPAPVITHPQDGRLYPKNDMTIAWNPVAGASQYDVAVRDMTNNQKIVGQDGPEGGTGAKTYSNSFKLSSSILTEGHTYKICISAVDANGSVSTNGTYVQMSIAAELVPPIITYPINGEIYTKTDMTLRWNAVSGASKYNVAVRDLTDNQKIVGVDGVDGGTGIETTALNYTIASGLLKSGHTYKVFLAAVDGQGNLSRNPTYMEFKISDILPKPNVLYPVEGKSYPKADLIITWERLTGASKYDVAVRDMTNNQKIVGQDGLDGGTGVKTSECSYTIPAAQLVEGHTYKICVSGVDSAGNVSSNSTYVHFSINETILTAPVIEYPVNNQSYTKGDLEIKWKPVPGAARYDLAVRDTSDNRKIVGQDGPEGGTGVKTTNTTFTLPAAQLVEGHQYKVCVASEDTKGNMYPTYITFEISSNRAPVLISPINKKEYPKSDILIEWAPVQGIVAYEVAVRDNTYNKKIIGEDGVDGGTGVRTTGTRFIISSDLLVEGHQYTLFVASEDKNGNQYETYCLITVNSNKKQTKIMSPGNGDVLEKKDIPLTWKKVDGVLGYLIKIYDLDKNEYLAKDFDNKGETGYTISSTALTKGHTYKVNIGTKALEGMVIWSEDFYIKIKNTQLTAPVVTHPSNYAALDKNNIQINWGNVPGAARYIIAVRDLNTNMQIVTDEDVKLSTSFIIPASKLEEGHKYKVAVGAVSDQGEQSWTEENYFSIKNAQKSLVPPVISQPKDGSVLKKENIMILWERVPGAVKYLVSVRDMNEDIQIVPNVDVGTETAYIIEASKLKEEHRYRYGIAAVDSQGNERWNFSNYFNTSKLTVKDNPSEISVTANGSKLNFDVPPTILNGRTLVPLRVIFESLGASVIWDSATKTITAKKDGKEIKLKIDSKIAYVNGVEVQLDVPAMIVNGRTLVPARFISESLGAKVDWNDQRKTVLIEEPDVLVLFPGQIECMKGVLNFEQEVSSVKVEIDRVGDFTYTGCIFEKSGLSLINFDMNQVTLKAAGEYLAVPGEFIARVTVVEKESGKGKEAARYKVRVVDPVVYKEVRYLPETDEVYVRADLHPLIGQRVQNEYPIVWVGVYNENRNAWDYREIDRENANFNNTMLHCGFNQYEKYIPAQYLYGNEKLKFTFFVDGYTDYDSIGRIKTEDRVITPLRKDDWNIRYNWETDELEAVVNPHYGARSKGELPLPYLAIYAGGIPEKVEEPLSVIPLYGGTVEEYKSKYFRSWTVDRDQVQTSNLHLQRGKSYKMGILIKGFEGQWSPGLLKEMRIGKPEITAWNIKYNPKDEKCTVWIGAENVTKDCAVKLMRVGSNKSSDIPLTRFYSYSPTSSGQKTFGLSELDLKMSNSYSFYIQIENRQSGERIVSNKIIERIFSLKEEVQNTSRGEVKNPPALNQEPAFQPTREMIKYFTDLGFSKDDFINIQKLMDQPNPDNEAKKKIQMAKLSYFYLKSMLESMKEYADFAGDSFCNLLKSLFESQIKIRKLKKYTKNEEVLRILEKMDKSMDGLIDLCSKRIQNSLVKGSFRLEWFYILDTAMKELRKDMEEVPVSLITDSIGNKIKNKHYLTIPILKLTLWDEVENQLKVVDYYISQKYTGDHEKAKQDLLNLRLDFYDKNMTDYNTVLGTQLFADSFDQTSKILGYINDLAMAITAVAPSAAPATLTLESITLPAEKLFDSTSKVLNSLIIGQVVEIFYDSLNFFRWIPRKAFCKP